MDSGQLVGTRGSAEMTVTDKDTAFVMGSGGVNVYSTPSMIALMEKAAQSSVKPLLDEGLVTVGVEVNIRHNRATPIGMRVVASSLLTHAEGKILYFKVTAEDEKGEIGSGTHTRAIVNFKRFMKKSDHS